MKKTSLLLITTLFVVYSFSQNIGIGTTTPNASAMLDIKATSKGVLIPRMTGTERTATLNPVEGLMVYDSTDRNVYIYKRLQGGWKKADFDLPYAGTDNNNISFQVNNLAPAASAPIGILGRHSNAAVGLALPAAVYGISNLSNGVGVIGESSHPTGTGVYGTGPLYGLFGFSFGSVGVRGNSTNGFGVYGVSINSAGVYGLCNEATGVGVQGQNTSVTGKAIGVKGMVVSDTDTTAGVWGEVNNSSFSYRAYGVIGKSNGNGSGVLGISSGGGRGVVGYSELGNAIYGESNGTAIYGRTYGAVAVSGQGFGNSTVAVSGEVLLGDNSRGVYGETTGTGSIAIQANGLGNTLYGLAVSNANGTGAYVRSNSMGATTEQLLIEENDDDYTRIRFKNIFRAPSWIMATYSTATGSSPGARFNIYYTNLNNGSGSDALSIDGNGNLTIAGNAFKPGGGAWNIPSDARLKKDIVDFNDGLSVINKIHPVSYHYNGLLNFSTEQSYIGVIAQELKQVAPYMVQKMNGNEEYLQVDPNAMTYLLINAVKELDRENKELRKELDLIKAKLSTNNTVSF